MKVFSEYRGLRRELYILFWGRVVTNMGALIWPMMTLILTDKMGYTPGQASNLILLAGFFLLPSTLIGGKLADKLNKKKLIVCCDMVTVTGYIVCAFLPLNSLVVVILTVSAVFAQLEWPSFDALVANMSSPEDRERAYSLNYLGANLGLVLAPILGGILFENHLDLAFLISGLATFSSTVLIFFFVRDMSREKGENDSYEEEKNVSIREVLSGSPVIGLFIACIAVTMALYGVAFSFLIPLSMNSFYGTRGALLLGTLTSVNALTVIVGTPLCTRLMKKIRDAVKLQIGAFLELLGCAFLAMAGANMIVCYFSMVVLTFGEIILSLGESPYISRRVPASHRGRMSAIRSVCQMTLQGVLLFAAGHAADRIPLKLIWTGIICLGMCNILVLFKLRRDDRRQFPLIYQ